MYLLRPALPVLGQMREPRGGLGDLQPRALNSNLSHPFSHKRIKHAASSQIFEIHQIRNRKDPCVSITPNSYFNLHTFPPDFQSNNILNPIRISLPRSTSPTYPPNAILIAE
jgi:hypothetical protein